MGSNTLFLSLDTITICVFLLVLVFSIGIVWRVEKKLDLSYKFFVAAAASIMLAEILGLYYADSSLFVLFEKIVRFSGAVLFLVSVLFMRDIVRGLDREK